MQATFASPFTTSRSLGTAPNHLGDDGGGGNAGDLGVTFHNITLIGNGTQRITIHEHAVGLQARVGNGSGDRFMKGAGHADLVDACRGDMTDADSRCNLRDSNGEHLALQPPRFERRASRALRESTVWNH